MPSHLTHQVLLEEALAGARISEPASGSNSPYAVLGAQGPDLFLHNQRRKPSALTYGSLVHRRGYGAVCAGMYQRAVGEGWGRNSWAFAYTVAFASHAILDRHTHPYINYWSGWRLHDDPASDRLRGMHPFLERLIDIEVLARFRSTTPLEFGFFDQIRGAKLEPISGLLSAGLKAVYPSARRDAQLPRRIESAYRDTMGYYEFTDHVDVAYLRQALEHESRPEVSTRWLSIVHPPIIPRDLDVMNEAHRDWTHPCSSREHHQESFWELFDRARAQMAQVASVMHSAWEVNVDRATVESNAQTIEQAVGNANLSDGRRTERPCRKQYSNPLPLPELQNEIRAAIGVER